MPEDSGTTGPGKDRQGPASPQRRKLLVTGAFMAASAVTLRKLPRANADRTDRGPHPPEVSLGTGLEEPPALDGAEPQPGPDHTYDVIITGGRVIDPDSGFDGTLAVGLDEGRITGFGPEVTKGRHRIDARGLVVSPGFIDVLSYEPTPRGSWYKIADGVTTNLGMHGMQEGWSAPEFFTTHQGATPVNFGGAFSDHWARYHHLGLNVGDTASADQRTRLASFFEEQLHQGWLGLALEPEYTPGVDFAEMLELARVAARHEVPCFVHGRYSSYAEESATVPEILRLGAESGAAVHVTHLPSTGGTWNIERALEQIDAAVDAGQDVTFCLYPYDYWGTYAASTRYAPGWQERFRIGFDDLQVAGTPDRLTARTFAKAKADNALTIAYAIPTESVRAALVHPRSMIGSDAIVDTGNNHPRACGAFCRVLGHWVRDEQALDLVDALAKMTIAPARRLQHRCPSLARKGRLQRGADADICVFDPDTVTDRATVEDPVAASTGIDWVLIGGTPVKTPGGLDRDQLVGEPVRSALT